MSDKTQLITMCNKVAFEVIDLLDIKDDIKTSEIMRQVAAAFIFGFVNAYALEQELEPPHVHGIIISILAEKFRYSDQQSVDFAQMLIIATKKENNPITNAIIHHGIDSYYQYQANNIDALRSNFYNVLSKTVGQR
jgi:hypothetical protein